MNRVNTFLVNTNIQLYLELLHRRRLVQPVNRIKADPCCHVTSKSKSPYYPKNAIKRVYQIKYCQLLLSINAVLHNLKTQDTSVVLLFGSVQTFSVSDITHIVRVTKPTLERNGKNITSNELP